MGARRFDVIIAHRLGAFTMLRLFHFDSLVSVSCFWLHRWIVLTSLYTPIDTASEIVTAFHQRLVILV